MARARTRGAQYICTCTTLSAAFSATGTTWPAADTVSFPNPLCLGNSALFVWPPTRVHLCARLDVKPVREPDDPNGHVRFDERGEETERWSSRREQLRKALLVLGAAGPGRHRAPPRLYPSRCGTSTIRPAASGCGARGVGASLSNERCGRHS